MFYSTQVKSIVAGGIIDMQGRYLKAVGRIPARVGDRVYTDGNVIFGDVKPKGSSLIVGEASGIPILSGNLRGYVSTRGKYKSYRIAGNEWIVNSDKVFAHDTDASNIIDAEIDADGNVYTVEKISPPLDYTPDDVLFYFWWRDTEDSSATLYKGYTDSILFTMADIEGKGIPDLNAHRVHAYWSVGEPEYERNDDTVVRDCTLLIRKNDEEIQRLTLSSLAKTTEDVVSGLISVDIPRHPHEDHIKSRASLFNFKILPDGSWQAVIELEVGAERNFHPHINDYPDLAARKQSSLAVHCLTFFKISSDGLITNLTEFLDFMPLLLVDTDYLHVDYFADTSSYNTHPPPAFPYTRVKSFAPTYVPADRTKLISINTVWDSSFMRNAPDYDEIQFNHSNEIFLSVQDGYLARLTFDSNYEPPSSTSRFYNPVQFWTFDSVIDKDGSKILEDFSSDKTCPFFWNMSLVPLKNATFLFGIRQDEEHEIDGALYKINKDGNIEQVGSGLKNFRMRELKQINKSMK